MSEAERPDDVADEKLDFAMAGHSMKLYTYQMVAAAAPRELPQFETRQSQKKGRNKTYCVMWGSGDLIADPEFDKSILIPFDADGSPNIAAVRKALVSAGKSRCLCIIPLAFQKQRGAAHLRSAQAWAQNDLSPRSTFQTCIGVIVGIQNQHRVGQR
jgi:hypothetical protein